VTAWARDAVIYHLYPLGCLGALRRNDADAPVDCRLPALLPWLDHLAGLGATALQLGPVFESASHGYDTLDLRRVDRRLGGNRDLAGLVAAAHACGIRVILDGVFHHVGRGHAAFQDVLEKGRASRFAAWFHLDFSRPGPRGEPFSYADWRGHDDLVKLNTENPETRDCLLGAAAGWIEEFGIDGLRLDAADVLSHDFQAVLAARCRALKPDFWLLGEVIHGDYSAWTGAGGLDSVTNYVLHKALWSAHNDANYFELAHTLNRQFGPQGDCRGLMLANFADNHDTMRIASRLKTPAHLYPLHLLLFALPGIPVIYYGSEAGIAGKADAVNHDWPLRPALTPAELARAAHPALRGGDYETRHVAPRSFAFLRRSGGETALVAVNAGAKETRLRLRHEALGDLAFADALNPGEGARARGGRLEVRLFPNWGAVLTA